jgi:hypothetical protein
VANEGNSRGTCKSVIKVTDKNIPDSVFPPSSLTSCALSFSKDDINVNVRPLAIFIVL